MRHAACRRLRCARGRRGCGGARVLATLHCMSAHIIQPKAFSECLFGLTVLVKASQWQVARISQQEVLSSILLHRQLAIDGAFAKNSSNLLSGTIDLACARRHTNQQLFYSFVAWKLCTYSHQAVFIFLYPGATTSVFERGVSGFVRTTFMCPDGHRSLSESGI